jgi:Domain of unknown function (DUF4384)
MRCVLLISITTMLLGLRPPEVSAQDFSTAVYEGVGYCVGTNIPDVERGALEDAKRDALDKAGTFIKASAKVSMYQLTESEISSFASGFVKVLDKDVRTEYDSVLRVVKATASIKAEIDNRNVTEGISSFLSANSSLDELNKTGRETDSELRFEFSLSGRKKGPDGEYLLVQVEENTVLAAGDQFQIFFRATRDCYVYVISIDSQGHIFPAFPNPEKGLTANHLSAGEQYILPSPNLYYELDDNPGQESLYFIGSLEPMRDISFILDNLKQMGGDNLALRGLLESRSSVRGIARITQVNDQADSTPLNAPQILQSYGSLLMKAVFQHR